MDQDKQIQTKPKLMLEMYYSSVHKKIFKNLGIKLHPGEYFL